MYWPRKTYMYKTYICVIKINCFHHVIVKHLRTCWANKIVCLWHGKVVFLCRMAKNFKVAPEINVFLQQDLNALNSKRL